MKRNLICELPDGHIDVYVWAPHPCGGWYVIDAAIYGPRGYVGRPAGVNNA